MLHGGLIFITFRPSVCLTGGGQILRIFWIHLFFHFSFYLLHFRLSLVLSFALYFFFRKIKLKKTESAKDKTVAILGFHREGVGIMGFSFRKFGHFLQACYVYIVNSLVLSLIGKSFNYIQLIA